LKAFVDVKDDTISYNFVFPFAAGNLKQLFRQELAASSIRDATHTLWHQFEGLSSAVAFLHEKNIAHRDIKPSNILLYEDYIAEALITKIADFGLSIGAKAAPKFEFGTLEARSAFKYDAPEVKAHVGERSLNPANGVTTTFKQLAIADIWKLAAVFTELLSHLVMRRNGLNGVDEFREFITTTADNITSDELSDIAYDDGVKVKDKVLIWLEEMGKIEVMGKITLECLFYSFFSVMLNISHPLRHFNPFLKQPQKSNANHPLSYSSRDCAINCTNVWGSVKQTNCSRGYRRAT